MFMLMLLDEAKSLYAVCTRGGYDIHLIPSETCFPTLFPLLIVRITNFFSPFNFGYDESERMDDVDVTMFHIFFALILFHNVNDHSEYERASTDDRRQDVNLLRMLTF